MEGGLMILITAALHAASIYSRSESESNIAYL